MTLPPRLPAPSARFLKALAAGCLFLAALLCAPPGAQAEERFIPDDLRPCASQLPADGYAMPCKAPLSSAERAALAGRLGERGFAYAVEGDSLLLVLKMAASALPYPRGPYICCEIQAYLDPAGTDLHAARIRWNRMPEALLDLHLLDVQDRPDAIVRHRGSPAFVMPAAGPAQQALAAAGIAVVTETIDAGPVLGRRKLTIATGARCSATLDGCTVVYMPDGGSTASLVRNAQDNGADMHGFVVVGLHNAETDPVGSRIGELLAGQEPARHQAYLRFMVEQLPARIEGGARPRRRLAAGYSNGGAWAFEAMQAHPGWFDGAIVMSPAMTAPPQTQRLDGHRVFIGAGYMEPRFHAKAVALAADLRARGAEVGERYVPSGHSMNTWVNVWNAAITTLNAQAQ